MRIGFDVSQTGRLKAGCGYFADSLIRNLAVVDDQNEYILYSTFGDFFWDPDWSTTTCRIERPNVRAGWGHATFDESRLFWRRPPEDFAIRLGEPHVIHANNFYCPVGLEGARLVYTLYDVSVLDRPEWTTEANRIGCVGGIFAASLEADLIIAISHYSRRRFLELFPHYPSNRAVVVQPASRFSGPRELRRQAALPALEAEGFWLSVGTLEPRKNHRGLVRAYGMARERGLRRWPLVLAGASGWLMDDFETEVGELGLRSHVILLGYVDDTALQWLYQNCVGKLYPSLYEGFGLPVLEAMSLGAPTIASKVTSIPEIVGDAALMVDPLSEEEICAAMIQLGSNAELRARLRHDGLRQAAKFSWTAGARMILECYRDVTSRPKWVDERRV
jgi:glycosyltransferase involved in cell wall biosynthesis